MQSYVTAVAVCWLLFYLQLQLLLHTDLVIVPSHELPMDNEELALSNVFVTKVMEYTEDIFCSCWSFLHCMLDKLLK